MQYPASPYVEERNGGLYVADSRVSLDSIVVNFRRGMSPDEIAQGFPNVPLAKVFGVLAYYLDNEQLIAEYLREAEAEFRKAPQLSETHPELYARIERGRAGLKKQSTWMSVIWHLPLG